MKTLYRRLVESAAVVERGPEVFNFFNYRFYIGRMKKMIEEKKIPAKLQNVNIAPWAEGMLGLKESTRQAGGIGMVMLDMKYVKDMPNEKLNDPGIMVLLKQGAIVVDGNHRLAKLYLDGKKEMKMWLVKELDAKKARVMTR